MTPSLVHDPHEDIRGPLSAINWKILSSDTGMRNDVVKVTTALAIYEFRKKLNRIPPVLVYVQ